MYSSERTGQTDLRSCQWPLLWDAFLTKFAEAVHAETAGLLTQDKAGHWARILAAVGMDPASRKSYEEYFVSPNPWLPRRKVIAGDVEPGEQVLSNRELVKTEFYKDFLKPSIWSINGNASELNANQTAIVDETPGFHFTYPNHSDWAPRLGIVGRPRRHAAVLFKMQLFSDKGF